MSLTVPGPRGMITDRNGEVMATSEVAYQPAILFNQLEDESDSAIVAAGRRVMAEFTKLGIKVAEKTDAQLIDHYRHRRWLRLPIGPILRESEVAPCAQRSRKSSAASSPPSISATIPPSSLPATSWATPEPAPSCPPGPSTTTIPFSPARKAAPAWRSTSTNSSPGSPAFGVSCSMNRARKSSTNCR